MNDRRATFVVARHGDIEAFESIERAAQEVEGYDVEADEYALFCTEDGERLQPRLLDQVRVELSPTGESAQQELVASLRQNAARNGIASDPSDPHAVALELLARRPR